MQSNEETAPISEKNGIISALIYLSARFDRTDKILSEQFDKIDNRFGRIDKRFDGTDTRLDRIEGKLDDLLERLSEKGSPQLSKNTI